MGWAGHGARVAERRDAYRFVMEKPDGKSPLEDLSIDGGIILRWMFMKWYMFAWIGLIWLMIERDGGLLQRQ
jgi:hypothetical protein